MPLRSISNTATPTMQRPYQEKQDIKAEKLGSHWKLKDRNVTVVNRI